MATMYYECVTHMSSAHAARGDLIPYPGANISRLSADLAAEYHPLRLHEVALREPPPGPQHGCELPPPSLRELFSSWLTTDTTETFDEYVLRSR